MAVALSRMLRYTSSYTSEIVSVEDEIRHLTDYLQIIAIRFTNEVTYQIDVDPACADADCLKAILQPMVENSIKHGIEQTGQPIHLDIRVGKLSPSRIFITVSDTGVGFSDAKLAELQRKMKGSDTWSKYNELVQVGLLNVHYRLNMYYPDGLSGIGIANEPGGGALVTLTFPLAYNRKRGD
jgi:two-component system, sensor histidine kinase YesM